MARTAPERRWFRSARRRQLAPLIGTVSPRPAAFYISLLIGGFKNPVDAYPLRFCGTSSVFNATGIVNGLTSTELGASFLLPRIVGLSRSNDMLLTGCRVEAHEAERIGLVSRVYPDEELMERAIETAEQMCEFSPFGLQMTKKVCWDNVEATSLTAAIGLEDRNQLLLGNTENLVECIMARKQKRKPIYTDRPRTDMNVDTPSKY